MRMMDGSSDVCLSDLDRLRFRIIAISRSDLPIAARRMTSSLRGLSPGILRLRIGRPWRRRASRNASAPMNAAARHRQAEGSSGLLVAKEQHPGGRSEEHTSELQSLMRISYAVFCLKKKKQHNTLHTLNHP